jgi:hypothetical protein
MQNEKQFEVNFFKVNNIYAFDDQVTKAEILWALESVQHLFNYKSSDETNKLFRSMFPDSKIAENVFCHLSCSRTILTGEDETRVNKNKEIKKLIDQEHQLLSKQKSLQIEQNKAQFLIGEGR